MRKTSLFAVALLGAALQAQSPLTTTFANNNGGGVGGGVYFDLTVNPAAGVNVVALDVNLTSAAATAGSIEMWTRPGTSVGFQNSNVGWTRVGVGNVVAAGVGLPTRCVFPSPANIPAGLNGVALCAVGVAHAYTNGNGTNQTYSTAELTLQAGTALNVCFGAGTPFSPRVVNCSIYYGGERFSRVDRTGLGCNTGAVSFYESWAAGTFDLSGGAARCTPNGNGGYDVTSIASNIVAPASVGLGLTDDSLSVQSLGFTFNYQTGGAPGSTTQIAICSNGFIHLNAAATDTDFSPSVTEALTLGPRIFALWCDLLPDGATNIANVFFDTAPGVARATWLNVPQFGGTGFTNMQVKIFSTGVVEVHFGAAAGHTAGAMIGGYSPGAANRDPGNRDLSVAIPFSTQTDSFPLDQFSSNPVINTTANLLVSNITAGSIGGVELIGGSIAPVPLNGIGMPGCFLHISPIALQIGFSTAGSTATTPLPIPNNNALLGVQVAVQAATVTPGANTLGVLSSNAALLTIGNF